MNTPLLILQELWMPLLISACRHKQASFRIDEVRHSVGQVIISRIDQAGRDVERGKAGSEDGQKPTGAALALSVNVACLNEKQESVKLGLVRSFLK